MTEKYTGKFHHIKEQAKSRWDEMKDQGGAKEAMTRKVEVVRSSFIRKVNAGEDYDHHYRRKSRLSIKIYHEGKINLNPLEKSW